MFFSTANNYQLKHFFISEQVSTYNLLFLLTKLISHLCLGCSLPLLVFPEEQITNGKRGLMKFKYVHNFFFLASTHLYTRVKQVKCGVKFK